MTGLPRPVAAGLGIGLAFIAGSVDATGLAAVGRFSSHMTGTTTHLMADLVATRFGLAGLGLSSLGCFLCGAVLCGAVLASRPTRVLVGTVAIVLGVEACAILAGGLAMLDRFPPTSSAALAIGLFAFAMGMQNATSSHLLAPYRRTTHLTSSLTDLGSELGVQLRAALGRTVSAPSATPAPDVLFSSAAVIVGFCLGAAAAGIGFASIGSAMAPTLAAAPALTAVLVVVSRVGPGYSQGNTAEP